MISTALANRAVVCSDALVHYLIIRDVEWPIIMIMAARQCPINERGWNEQKMITIVTKCGPGSFIAAIPDWALDARDCAGRKHAVRHMHNTAVIHARFRMTSENKGHWNPRTSLPWARTKEREACISMAFGFNDNWKWAYDCGVSHIFLVTFKRTRRRAALISKFISTQGATRLHKSNTAGELSTVTGDGYKLRLEWHTEKKMYEMLIIRVSPKRPRSRFPSKTWRKSP